MSYSKKPFLGALVALAIAAPVLADQTPDSATPVAREEMRAPAPAASSADQSATPQAGSDQSVKAYEEPAADGTGPNSGDRPRAEMQSHVHPFPWDKNG